jgi:hypothetical protein
MRKITIKSATKMSLFIVLIVIPTLVFSQQDSAKVTIEKSKRDFWRHVQFGGGFGLLHPSGMSLFAVMICMRILGIYTLA